MRKKPVTGRRKRPGYTVFLSHSSNDRWVARQIRKEIEAAGASVWLDQKDLHGGDVLEDAIHKGITGSQEGVVLISNRSVKSWWVAYEIGALRVQKKRVTPVLIGVDPKGPLAGVKAIDLNDFDTYLLELRKRLR
jgi:hypothetical protein